MEDFETTTILLEPLRPTPDGRLLRMKTSSFVASIANFHSRKQGRLVTTGTSAMGYEELLSQGSVSENAQQASVAVNDKACQTEPFVYPRKIASTPPPHKLSGIALPVQRTAAVAPCGPASNDSKEDATRSRQTSDPCDVNKEAFHVLNCHLTRLKNCVLIVKSYRPTEMNHFVLSYVELLMRLTFHLLDGKRDQRTVLQNFESIRANTLAARRLWHAGSSPRSRVPREALQYPESVERYHGHQHERPSSHFSDLYFNDTGTDSADFNGKYATGDSISTVPDGPKRPHEISRSTSPSSKRARHEITSSSQETARPTDPRLQPGRRTRGKIESPTRDQPQKSSDNANRPELADTIKRPCSSAMLSGDVSPLSDAIAAHIAASDENNDSLSENESTQINSNTTVLQNTESKPPCDLIGNVAHDTDMQNEGTSPIIKPMDSHALKQTTVKESLAGEKLKPAESDTRSMANHKQPGLFKSSSNHTHSPDNRRSDRSRGPRSTFNANGYKRNKINHISTQITQRTDRDRYAQDQGGGEYESTHRDRHDPSVHINHLWSLGRTRDPRGYNPPRMEDYAGADRMKPPYHYRRGRYY